MYRKYDPLNEDKVELAKLNHPSRSDVLSIQSVKRKDNDVKSVDIRWMYQKEDGSYAFTQKGLRIPDPMIPDVLEALQSYVKEQKNGG